MFSPQANIPVMMRLDSTSTVQVLFINQMGWYHLCNWIFIIKCFTYSRLFDTHQPCQLWLKLLPDWSHASRIWIMLKRFIHSPSISCQCWRFPGLASLHQIKMIKTILSSQSSIISINFSVITPQPVGILVIRSC